MGEMVECTKAELIEAFRVWNEEYQENKEMYREHDDPKQDAVIMAEYLILKLKEIQ